MSKNADIVSKMTTARHPTTDEDWRALRQYVLELFTPGAPIDEVALFAGRQEQIQKLQDTSISKGRHAVVFGERGVGKTSLVNIFHLDTAHAKTVWHIYTQCTQSDTFDDIWRRAFKRIKFSTTDAEFYADQIIIDRQLTPDDVELILNNFTNNDYPVIVFDEFDRVLSLEARRLMSETIKQLSNSPKNTTIIIVGVANSVTDIIEQHQSIARALVQVQMPRMNMDELKNIITSRLRRTQIKVQDNALWRISYLSSGLPFYTHALGQAASLLAIEKKCLVISEGIVKEAIPRCFQDLDQSLLNSYALATITTRKGNLFKEVLAACALAEQDDLGRFSASDVEKTLSGIVGSEMKAPAFSFHLNELCSDERGKILNKSGTRSHFRFRFVEPMMQPFIIMKSLSSDVIQSDIVERYATQRQMRLSI
jgi:archaellum biogenesis ATPase FlaH